MTFSIGDVLEQLSDEFPDITVSKIRFLESQGLISPMRTASGFRMFSDVDITKLHWILLHQRDRFLPLKVIKEYLATLTDEDFSNGKMPAFDFEQSGALPLEGNDNTAPQESKKEQISTKHLAAVPDVTNNVSEFKPKETHIEANAKPASTLVQEEPIEVQRRSARKMPSPSTSRAAIKAVPKTFVRDSILNQFDVSQLSGSTESITPRKPKSKKLSNKSVLSLDEMTIETSISGPVLKELVSFGILESSGSGNSMVFPKSELALALVIQPLLERGLEPRHLKNYVLFASREAGFLEHVVQDDLRRRNPEANQIALEKAKQFIQDTAQLKEYLLLKALKDQS